MGVAPPWPSLYNPSIEITRISGREARQPEGYYLDHPVDVFLFTFYWSLVLYLPIYALCGAYAFLNISFPPSMKARIHALSLSYPPSLPYQLEDSASSRSTSSASNVQNESYPLQPIRHVHPHVTPPSVRRSPKKNKIRSRILFAILVLLLMLVMGLASVVVSSAVLGFIFAGLYKVAHYNLSTWVPFLLAVVTVLLGLLNIWPIIIDIV